MAGGRPSFEDTKKGGNFQYLSTARCNKMLIVVRDADQGGRCSNGRTAMNSRLLPIWNASGIALAMTRSAGVIVDQWQYDITRSFFLECFGHSPRNDATPLRHRFAFTSHYRFTFASRHCEPSLSRHCEPKAKQSRKTTRGAPCPPSLLS